MRDFSEEFADHSFDDAIGDKWIEWSERTLPRKSSSYSCASLIIDLPQAALPRTAVGAGIFNADGVPAFPDFDLDEATRSSLQAELQQYFDVLWGESYFQIIVKLSTHIDPEFSFKNGKSTAPIPWDAISNEPGSFYDTDAFLLPVPLRNPATYSRNDAFAIAEWLTENCGANSVSPLQFIEKDIGFKVYIDCR